LIKEIVVVEGKDDMAAVKKACIAEVIITNGLGIREETVLQIKKAQERCGVIILTDPDYPGEKIRRIISEKVPGCRHAYIYQEKGRGKKIGVEYAAPEEIRKALQEANTTINIDEPVFFLQDLFENGLIGDNKASWRRSELGRILRIGTTNAKQFLKRLNSYGIKREEFKDALKMVGE
jgi:ribonuclease M5